jgi:hypothetical protein
MKIEKRFPSIPRKGQGCLAQVPKTPALSHCPRSSPTPRRYLTLRAPSLTPPDPYCTRPPRALFHPPIPGPPRWPGLPVGQAPFPVARGPARETGFVPEGRPLPDAPAHLKSARPTASRWARQDGALAFCTHPAPRPPRRPLFPGGTGPCQMPAFIRSWSPHSYCRLSASGRFAALRAAP